MVDTVTAPIVQRLKTARLRPTRQRVALAGLLFAQGDRHVTAEQLHQEALADAIRVSLATVYNTLHQFTAAGLLREVVVEAGRSYFDTNVSDHHHFFHVDGGRLVDIAGDAVAVGQLPAAPPGTAVERVEVIIRLRDRAQAEAARAKPARR
jgi:Fur family transcriptional regulator, iron response regulator